MKKMVKKEMVSKTDLMNLLDLMESISGMGYWLDGGWGVDVLVGPGSTGTQTSTLTPGIQMHCWKH